MARWHLTLALTAAAVAALTVAPRLTALTPADTPPTNHPSTVPAAPPGTLSLEAGLDRDAVIGHGEERFLVIRLGAPKDGGDAVDRPVDLAVVMDASGSMSARGKIDYAKRAAKLLASNLDGDDRFSLVTFNDAARTLIPATPVRDIDAIHRAIDGVYEGGGTNLYAGMEHGADQVRGSIRPEMVGRVVVLSDGQANVGLTTPAAFEQFSAELAATGIAVSSIGLGRDYNEDLLAQMADIGGGSYDYVDDPGELGQVLADELERTTSVVARGVRVAVTLPPHVELLDVIGWETERNTDGWSVWLGDVYAGEERKIIARVRVGSVSEGDQLMASVHADYHDLLLDSEAETVATANASVTRDQRRAARSAHRDRSIASQQAFGAWHLEKSVRAWEAGDRREAEAEARQAQAIMEQAAMDFEDDALGEIARELQAVGSLGTPAPVDSYEGKGAVKAAKETYRALAR